MNATTLYWLSWHQPTGDHRPLTYPPNPAILGWWCSGYADDTAIICALVEAVDGAEAEAAVLRDWPEAKDWRFNTPKPNAAAVTGGRFPVAHGWMRERIADYNARHPTP